MVAMTLRLPGIGASGCPHKAHSLDSLPRGNAAKCAGEV
jgi:hypothetical protein